MALRSVFQTTDDWTSWIREGDYRGWTDLISFRPPAEVQKRVYEYGKLEKPIRVAVPHGSPITITSFKTRVQHLENAYGKINLDYYPVEVSQLPFLPSSGKRASASELLSYIRTNLTSGQFTNSSICKFDGTNAMESARWVSSDPVGSIIHIDMYSPFVVVPTPHPVLIPPLNIESGSVVCSYSSMRNWIFSTVQIEDGTKGHKDGYHPVSGNREFGFWQSLSAKPTGNKKAATQNEPRYIFYVRAADRIATWIDANAPMGSNAIFAGGHGLWLSFQEMLWKFVCSHGGEALKLEPISSRHDWESVKEEFFKPTMAWVYN